MVDERCTSRCVAVDGGRKLLRRIQGRRFGKGDRPRMVWLAAGLLLVARRLKG